MSCPLIILKYNIAFRKFLKAHISDIFERLCISCQKYFKSFKERKMLNRRNQLPTSNLVTHNNTHNNTHGPCDYSVIPSSNWTFGFGTSLGLGMELGLRGPDLGLGLDNNDALPNVEV